MTPISPLAPAAFPALPDIAGVRLAATECGERYRGRSDLTLIELAPGTTAAGVFTRSQTASGPVEWCRAILKGGTARAMVVNAGNANAFTGAAGRTAVRRTAETAAACIGAGPEQVFIASTGVIGEALSAGKIEAALPGLAAALDGSAWEAAARAIMTTDTFPKGATRTARIDGETVTVSGFAKGSGMIAPDMATMLSFVFTDAAIPPPMLQTMLARGANRSFNAITVDGDTSTSDTLLAFATGQANHGLVIRAGEARLGSFRKALNEVLVDLAQQVVRDGEGAQKFITIKVSGAASARAARRIGLAIGNSPLVKTAIAGADANWGRVVMAVGKAGEKADRDRMSISMGGVLIAEYGEVHPDYDEAQVAPHMQGSHIDIAVDVGVGRGKATVWTCDLTHGYIDINADYRS
ncbi:MAG: bifunctional glutamate N-acetyltransferase/amino-acid acetyltransferase ArgJ [Pseudomonadota bacterium]|nr:bifunctional glutamate N-acetyltransferase/amino-acid acetyltransferase ArgJ [Pseudomonadota bacterium]